MIGRPIDPRINQPLRLGFGAFVVAAVAAALGFASDYFAIWSLGAIAYVVVVAAVLCGFASIAWGWYRMFRRKAEGER